MKVFKVHNFDSPIILPTKFGVLEIPSEIDCNFAKRIYYGAYKPCLNECIKKWNDFLDCYEECFVDIFEAIINDPNDALKLLNFVRICLEEH